MNILRGMMNQFIFRRISSVGISTSFQEEQPFHLSPSMLFIFRKMLPYYWQYPVIRQEAQLGVRPYCPTAKSDFVLPMQKQSRLLVGPILPIIEPKLSIPGLKIDQSGKLKVLMNSKGWHLSKFSQPLLSLAQALMMICAQGFSSRKGWALIFSLLSSQYTKSSMMILAILPFCTTATWQKPCQLIVLGSMSVRKCHQGSILISERKLGLPKSEQFPSSHQNSGKSTVLSAMGWFAAQISLNRFLQIPLGRCSSSILN